MRNLIDGLISVFDIRPIIEEEREIWLFYFFIGLWGIFALGIVPDDVIILTTIAVFTLAKANTAFFMFIFFFAWEFVAVFSFGVTEILILEIILFIKMQFSKDFVLEAENPIQSVCFKTQKVLLLLTGVYTIPNFFLWNSLTGTSLFIKAFIFNYAISYLYDEDAIYTFLKSLFKVIMISSILATVYGQFHEVGFNDRWISGMGYATQLRGTLGTTRMALFYIVGFSYFLYFEKNNIKIIGSLLFLYLTFKTISLTALLLSIVVFAIYCISQGQLIKVIYTFIFSILFLIMSYGIWSKLDVVQPLFYRMKYSVEAFERGDIDKATSSREETASYFFKTYDSFNIVDKTLGTAGSETMTVIDSKVNTHNTYMDFIIYWDVLGLSIMFLCNLLKIIAFRQSESFFPYLTIKLIMILAAATVSIKNATYYNFFILF